MKTAFLLLGAPRSGTSVIAHILSKFGIDFGNPEHFLDTTIHKHNPIFFELEWVNHCNDSLLTALGNKLNLKNFSWFFQHLAPSDSSFLGLEVSETEERMLHWIHQEWQGAPIVGIKDPRFCFTFPVWQKVLEKEGYELKVILIFRSPLSYLKSTRKLYEWLSDSKSLNLWLQHNLAATYFARDYPIYFVSYEEVMSNPAIEIQKMAEHFGFDPALIDKAISVVDKNYWHHQSAPETGIEWVDRCYQALQEGRSLNHDYLKFQSIFLLFIEEIRQKENSLEEQNQHLQTVRSQLEQSRTQLESTQAELHQSHSDLTQTQSQLESTQLQLQQSRFQLNDSQYQLEQTQTQLNQAEAQLNNVQTQLAQVKEHLQHKQTQVEQLRSKLKQQRNKLKKMRQQIAVMESSKFWKLRQAWFKLKQKVGLETEE
jgi:hypothetical protein